MTRRVDPTDTAVPAPIAALDAAVCSDGAPSARNLIVTVFGDLVLPNEDAIGKMSVQTLARLLAPFGVNDRLVRTSLSRVVGDGLLEARSQGRRSSYSVADGARSTFARAERRIYGGAEGEWDGEWTIVVIDGTMSTPDDRAELRRRLGWAGFGSVAPNVMASPLVDAPTAADIVGRSGGGGSRGGGGGGGGGGGVLIARSRVLDDAGLIGADHLVRRSIDLDVAESAHRDLLDRFDAFDDATLASLDDARCFKLRLLLVAAFRRVALAEPSVPRSLLPAGWVGLRSRRVAARIYASIAQPSDRWAGEVVGASLATPGERFVPPEEPDPDGATQLPTGSSIDAR